TVLPTCPLPILSPLATPSLSFLYSPLSPALTPTHPPQPLNICTKTVHLFISIYLKLLSISTVFISYVSYLIYNFYCHFHLYFTCTLHTVYLYHISISHLH